MNCFLWHYSVSCDSFGSISWQQDDDIGGVTSQKESSRSKRRKDQHSGSGATSKFPSLPQLLSGPLYVSMLATPVIIDIQNKDVLIFNWVELSSSAEHFSDLPVGSALLPYAALLLLPLSFSLCLFISKVIFTCSSRDAETSPINCPRSQLKFPTLCILLINADILTKSVSLKVFLVEM